jgi:predicted acylesterase/phospholipase RssA
MLHMQEARRVRSLRRPHRIGLAVAGGGPIGGIYEMGALRALDEAIEGLDLTRLDVYVGVSSGAFLAAGLANRVDSATICRMFITEEDPEHQFRPEMFLKPAFFEYIRRLGSLPKILGEWLLDMALHPGSVGWSESLGRLGAAIPTGLFDNEGIERYLNGIFSAPGRTNDFRNLDRPLYVVAVDLDTGHAVRFGSPGDDAIPISKAVQASSALPGFYPPVEINGRYYVDGALQRTLHASVALDEDLDLLLALNPLVPFDASAFRDRGDEPPGSLVDGGLPRVISQTIRAMLYSRMRVGFGNYEKSYDHSDLVLFQPDLDDAEMFFTNVFSFASRRHLCEHAYSTTLADLRRRRKELGPVLERHGLRLREDILDDAQRSVWDGLVGTRPPNSTVLSRLDRALNELDRVIARTHAQRRARSRALQRKPTHDSLALVAEDASTD